MKKLVVPAILLVLVVLLFAFLKADPFEPRLSGERYLLLREEIDAANVEIFSTENPDAKESAVVKRIPVGRPVAMRNLEQGESPAKRFRELCRSERFRRDIRFKRLCLCHRRSDSLDCRSGRCVLFLAESSRGDNARA